MARPLYTNKYEKERIIFVLLTMTVSILTLFLDSIWFKGVVSAEWWAYSFSATFLLYSLIRKDILIQKLLLFGIIAGFAELIADYWLVAETNSLVYPEDELFLLKSPAYMPFSWIVVLVEFGFLGWLITHRFNLIISGLILAVLGALLVPLYEHWAIHAKWWYYHNTSMIGPVPYYVIVAEGLLMIPVPYMTKKITDGKWIDSVKQGLAEGLVMLIACFVAWYLFGKMG